MKPTAISVRNLAKQYRIGTAQPRYKTLRESLASALGSIRRLGRRKHGEDETFWAVKDVSFEISEGEIVGVIGRNGAGKSTLLKLMSRITNPTEGSIEIYGRVGSLLEVGTGFHPELSGRENIYMNGAILGMRKSEIERKFDAIVEFAEVERFIDLAVKHYSSGMYLRLAFSVAAHLDPEILIVDEVLAVGDASFQKKCLGKMDEVSRQGRTVLFVSHNMVAVEKLCTRAIIMDKGQTVFDGDAQSAIEFYLAGSGATSSQDLRAARRQAGSGEIRIIRYEVIGSAGRSVRSGESFTIRMHFHTEQPVRRPCFSVSILTHSGTYLFSIFTSDHDYQIPELFEDGYIDLEIESPNLLAGSYVLHLGVSDESVGQWYDLLTEGAQLEIEPADVYGTGRQRGAHYSLLFYRSKWSHRLLPSAELVEPAAHSHDKPGLLDSHSAH